MPCNKLSAKIGSQSRKGWLTPKIAMKLLPSIWKLAGKPSAPISSNLLVPPASKFISMLKKIKLGTKPYQKRFSLVASSIPLPARANSSSHFLQFMITIITHVYKTIEIYYFICGSFASSNL